MRYIEKLRRLKQKSKLTYKIIGSFINYTEANTARLFSEENKNIPIEVIIKLCKLFNVSLYEILIDDENIDTANLLSEERIIYQKNNDEKLKRLEKELQQTTQRLNDANSELLKFYKEKYEEKD